MKKGDLKYPDRDFLNRKEKCNHNLKYKVVNDVREYCPDCGSWLYDDMNRKENKMRYFNVKQHREPTSMFFGNRKVYIADLEETANEITEEKAKQKPSWGSGNISVNETGEWHWEATNHDSSG